MRQREPTVREPGHPHPGASTAFPGNVGYRLGKLKAYGLLRGVWLDCGCAEGGYTQALVEWGADRAVGIDPDPERIAAARRDNRNASLVEYHACSESFPFPAGTFDGVLLNEVLEHVSDEATTLREARRVLRRSGRLVVMSPNRWFPFEGHGMEVAGRKFGFPIPLLPWLPSSFSSRFMAARNYWPRQLIGIVRNAGFAIEQVDYILPTFELYEWMPRFVADFYREAMPLIERTPLRKLGVSTLVIASPAP